MDVLKTQLERIQRQLAGLTATQKMLTAALVAIMAITVVWWGKYAGESEMVPLSSQSFSASELGRINDKLNEKGYRSSVSGDKILVPAEQRTQILALLIYSKSMPHGTHEAMEEILKQRNVFDSESTTERIWNHGKEALLSEMIGSFPDVESATVIVNPTEQYRVGASVKPTATVNIKTTADAKKNNHAIAEAAAEIVSGAQSGLDRNNIKVVINGSAQRVSDASGETIDPTDQLQTRQQYEAYAEDHIRNLFNIAGLQVAVSIKINTTSIVKDQTEYDAKNVVQKETQSSSETDETSSAVPAPGGEGGAAPNTGASVAGPSGSGGQSQNHEKQEQKFDVKVPETQIHSKTPAGDVVPLGATVRFPISYFAGIYHRNDPSAQQPTAKELDAIVASQLPTLREAVMHVAGLQSIDQVTVTAYMDPLPVEGAPVTNSAASSGAGIVALLAGGHAKEIALGALAVMSLFMASMMVRKGQPAPVPAIAATPVSLPGPTPVLSAGEPLAGEAGSGDPLLDGMELNEDAIKAQQMVDQVSTMVRENPDAAATLVKRWLNRT